MHAELTKWKHAQARAEARLEGARTDAEYSANLELLRYASAMIDQTLAKLNRW